MEFRWNAWNTDHIAEHGISGDEAAFVVEKDFRGRPAVANMQCGDRRPAALIFR